MSPLAGIIVANTISLNRKFLAKTYLKSWFLVDLLGVFPFEMALQLCRLERSVTLMKTATILGVVKLCRVVSLVRHVNKWQAIYVSIRQQVLKIKYIPVLSSALFSLLLRCVHRTGPSSKLPTSSFPSCSWRTSTDACFTLYRWSKAFPKEAGCIPLRF